MHILMNDSHYTELGDSIAIEVYANGDVHFRNDYDCQLYELPGGSVFVGERNDEFEAIKVKGFCEGEAGSDPNEVYVMNALRIAKTVIAEMGEDVFKYDPAKRRHPDVVRTYRVALTDDVNNRHRFDNFPFTLEAKRIEG